MDANPLSAPGKRCLRQKESLECLRKEGLHVQANYPKSSQDLNGNSIGTNNNTDRNDKNGRDNNADQDNKT